MEHLGVTDEFCAANRNDICAPPLRIGHMIGSFEIGGAERQVVNLLNELPPGDAVLIVLRETHGVLEGQVQSGVSLIKVSVRRRSLPAGILRLARALREVNLDVLQTHMFWSNFAGVMAGKLAGVPVIVTTEHGRNERKSRWARWIERFLISRLADRRVCVSEDILRLRNSKDGVPLEKLCVVTNGTPVREPRVLQGKSPLIIGTLGRLIDAKDFPTMIKAARVLRDRGADFRLVIVGDGPQHARVVEEIRANGLQEVVQLPGFSDDTQAWLERFDVYLISSVREGQPLSLLEAMAVGLPIVATRVGGIPDTIKDKEEGLLVPPGDPIAMAEALHSLASDLGVRRRLGSAARDRLIKDFSVTASLKQYMDIYMSILKSKEN